MTISPAAPRPKPPLPGGARGWMVGARNHVACRGSRAPVAPRPGRAHPASRGVYVARPDASSRGRHRATRRENRGSVEMELVHSSCRSAAAGNPKTISGRSQDAALHRARSALLVSGGRSNCLSAAMRLKPDRVIDSHVSARSPASQLPSMRAITGQGARRKTAFSQREKTVA